MKSQNVLVEYRARGAGANECYVDQFGINAHQNALIKCPLGHQYEVHLGRSDDKQVIATLTAKALQKRCPHCKKGAPNA